MNGLMHHSSELFMVWYAGVLHPHMHTLHRRGYPNQGGSDFCIFVLYTGVYTSQIGVLHTHVHTWLHGYPNQGGGDFCILHLLPAAFATC